MEYWVASCEASLLSQITQVGISAMARTAFWYAIITSAQVAAWAGTARLSRSAMLVRACAHGRVVDRIIAASP
jgi:hypothetical protein